MRLRFDDYVLDVVRCELWRGSDRVAIEPQVFDLLAYLAQNPDRVVSRDELLRAIWDGRIVSDSAIANRINAARRAIGDSGEAQRLIRTVPRKGFRFVSQVAEAPVEAAPNQVKTGYRRSVWRLAGAALVGAAIATILARLEPLSGRHPAFQPETGVLPSTLVSTLPLKVLGAGGGEPGQAGITAGEPAIRGAALLRYAARAAPAITKSNRDVAAAALPAGPVLPAATLVGPVLPAAAEQKQKAPLLDVTAITAPPTQQVNPFNSFSGHTRIDEANWPVIPCASARIDLGAGAKCQAGPPVSWGGHCDIARQRAMIINARYQIEADVMIFDPTKVTATGSQGKNCAVWAGYTNMPDDFKDMNQITRRGSGWANFVKGSLQSTASFADGGRNCIAVERLGPPWHGGYVWVVHASVCPAAAGTVQAADIDAMFAMLQLRTYDAQSNLRAQLQ